MAAKAPDPIVGPLPPWARALIQVAPYIAAGLQFVVDHIGEAHDFTSTTPLEWRRVVLSARLKSVVDTADTAVTSFDLARQLPDGSFNGEWTQTNEDTVDVFAENMAVDWQPLMTNKASWLEAKVYKMQFTGPLSQTGSGPDKPFPPTGPPLRIVPIPISGTAAVLQQASQVAYTTTDHTPYRKHWGRNYWPFPDAFSLEDSGHILDAACDQLVDRLHNHYGTAMAVGVFPVTVVTRIQGYNADPNGAPLFAGRARALLTTTAISMDDVPDVQRRRRPHAATHHAQAPF